MTHLVLVVIFGFLLLPGLVMAFIPMLPAFWYLLAVSAIFGIADGFTHLTLQNLGILAVVLLLSVVVDWSAGILGAKFGGAAWRSLLWGMTGGLIGFLLFPPIGVFPGLFTGVFAGEIARRKDGAAALRAATGALIGSLAGVAVNTTFAVAFIILFLAFALF